MNDPKDKLAEKKASERTLQQIFDVWINPEIERRKKEDFKVSKAQIVFSVGESPRVRLNDEVKAIFRDKVNNLIDERDLVFGKNIEEIDHIELTNGDANSAHITLLKFKDNWMIWLDFIYNKKKIEEHIEASKEFYESAKESFEKGRLRSFFENAFASAELSAMSHLLRLPNKGILTGRSHKDRREKYKEHANLGNVRPTFSHTLSKLSLLRDSARYLHSDDYKNEDPSRILRVLEEMIAFKP